MSRLARLSSSSSLSSLLRSGHHFSLPSISSHFSSPLRPSVISPNSLPSSFFVLNVRSFVTGTQVGAPLRRKMTVVEIQKKRDAREKISMVTAYTYPSAMHVDAAAIDVLLCGDSVAMVELGHDTTLPVTVDEMLYHCKAVARGASYPLLVGDMPFGSYEASATQAYQTAVRFLKEGGMDCVKIEGGKIRSQTIRTLVQGGVAVMGHIGLTPQRISVLGGFRAQGRTLAAAKDLIEDALELQDAGCFAIVIECVPPAVAEAITAALKIPTIGIGAGPHCSGQVLVYHDLLGMLEHAHHAAVVPSFCKSYAKLGDIIQKALDSYKKDVEGGIFPGDQYSPYKMNEKDSDTIKMELKKAVDMIRREKGYTSKENQSQQKDKSNTNAGTDETIKLY